LPIDVSRYGFITNEFRYNYARDATITARYKKARAMKIDSNLDDSAAAQTLCNAIFAVIGVPRRRFEVVTGGTEGYSIDDFIGGPKGVTLKAPEDGVASLDGIVTRIVIDEDQDQVIHEVWG
jgi:hypothetical protein